MKVGYVTSVVDTEKGVFAPRVNWIRSLASHGSVEAVHVLTSRRGVADLPANVVVTEFGRGYRGLARLFGHAIHLASEVDFFFVHGGGPYPGVLLPIRVVFRRPVYQWKAHAHVSHRMRFYARWCDDLVFTASSGSLPIRSPKVRVIGHGVDTEVFRPSPHIDVADRRDIIYLGRIAPIKRIEAAIRALALCQRRSGSTFRLDLVGPGRSDYVDSLLSLASQQGLSHSVRYLGECKHQQVPDLLGGYRAMVNFGQTALDKTTLEAMACGIPVITTNVAALEVLPGPLREVVGADEGNQESEAAAVHRVMSLDLERYREVGEACRVVVVEGHSLDELFEKMLRDIVAHQGGRG